MLNLVCKRICKIVLSAALAFAVVPADAADYPARPVRLIVPFPAGSATDAITRIIANQLTESFGYTMVVENKAGADGSLAAVEVKNAAPDGYTLVMATNSPLAAVPTMRKTSPYNPLTDFTPITFIGKFNYFVLIDPNIPAKSFAEFISYAKANPRQINYGSGNTTGIVATAQIQKLANIEMLHVPYKGEPPALLDLVAGRLGFMVATQTTTLPFVLEGKLRALATTSSARSKAVPDVPTMAEVGMKEFSILPWAALVGPPKMPGELVQKISRDFTAVLNMPDVRKKIETQFFEPSGSTPAELAQFLREQVDTWTKLVDELGLKQL